MGDEEAQASQDENETGDEAAGGKSKTNADMAISNLRRARKGLPPAEENPAAHSEALIAMANVHATLALAEAVRSSKGE